jgi:hypothetical protein
MSNLPFKAEPLIAPSDDLLNDESVEWITSTPPTVAQAKLSELPITSSADHPNDIPVEWVSTSATTNSDVSRIPTVLDELHSTLYSDEVNNSKIQNSQAVEFIPDPHGPTFRSGEGCQAGEGNIALKQNGCIVPVYLTNISVSPNSDPVASPSTLPPSVVSTQSVRPTQPPSVVSTLIARPTAPPNARPVTASSASPSTSPHAGHSESPSTRAVHPDSPTSGPIGSLASGFIGSLAGSIDSILDNSTGRPSVGPAESYIDINDGTLIFQDYIPKLSTQQSLLTRFVDDELDFQQGRRP